MLLRRCTLKFFASFGVGLLATTLAAQTLEFTDAPTLDGVELAALGAIDAALREAMSGWDAETGSIERVAVRDAQRTMRRIIIELAQRAQTASPAQHAVALTAFRLNAALPAIDDLFSILPLASPFTGTPPEVMTDRNRHRAIAKLQRFAASGLAVLRRSSTQSTVDLDRTMATVLAPIVEVMSLMEHQPLISRWPSDDDVLQGFRSTRGAGLAPLEGSTPEAMLDQRLRTAAQFADLTHTATLLRTALHATRPTGETLLNDEAAAALRTRRERAIALAADPKAWAAATASLEVGLEALRVAKAIETTEALTSRRDVPPRMLHDAWLNAVAVEDPHDARVLLGRTHVLVEALGRSPNAKDIPRSLRVAFRAVETRQKRLERSLVNVLPRIAADPLAMRDPEISGLLSALSAAEDDLMRLRVAAANIDVLSLLQPSTAQNIARVVRGWCQRLGDDAARRNAAAILDEISLGIARSMPLAFEGELRAASPLAERLTGGRSKDLLRRLDSLRAAWAQEISNGIVSGGASDGLARMARLGALLEDLHFVTEQNAMLADVFGTANRWGGWFVPSSALAWSMRSLEPGLKLAAMSALNPNPTAFEGDLARLEHAAPPLRLLAFLAANLTSPLAGVRDGASGTIAATALPPPPNAWLRAFRLDLAAICRALIEHTFAATTDANDTAEELQSFIVIASIALLEELGDASP
jgi:hypothetical protein